MLLLALTLAACQGGAGPTGEFAAYKCEALFPYFARRHAQRGRLRLIQIPAGAGPGWDGGWHFALWLNREVDDLSAGDVTGKGALDCENGTIHVWSMTG